MQEGSSRLAEQLYSRLIELQLEIQHQDSASCGRLYHSQGAALLDQGRCGEAHVQWRTGLRNDPEYPPLQHEVRKADAFTPATDISRSPLSSPVPCFRIDVADEPSVFLTKARMLSVEECKQAVDLGEAFAAGNNGWSTSRHYAVPTTDLPIHSIPPLLAWFNATMRDKLVPLLVTQFSTQFSELCISVIYLSH